jgi:hypothetical protein
MVQGLQIIPQNAAMFQRHKNVLLNFAKDEVERSSLSSSYRPRVPGTYELLQRHMKRVPDCCIYPFCLIKSCLMHVHQLSERSMSFCPSLPSGLYAGLEDQLQMWTK